MRLGRACFALAVLVLLCSGSAKAQDPGVPDTVALITTATPDFTTGQTDLEVELWVYSDEVVRAATAGFTWDNPDIQMDSAVAEELIVNGFEIGPFLYEDDDIAVTNANQRFVIGGSVIFGDGVAPDASGRRLWATYHFTANSWGQCSEVMIDTLTFSEGSVWLFVGEGVEFAPLWGGPVNVADSACTPTNLVVSPTALTFNAEEGGANPTNQTFTVDSDGDALSFSLAEGIPWLTVAPSSGTTPQGITESVDITGLTEGTYVDSVEVASAGADNSPLYVVVTLNVTPPPNQPPVIDPVADQEVTESETLQFTVTASDPDGTTPVLSADGLPTGATFQDNNDGTGSFIWLTDFDDAGTYPVWFLATDAEDAALVDSTMTTITVLDSNRVPTVAIEPLLVEGFEGDVLTMYVTASDPDGTTPQLSLDLPAPVANLALVDSGNGNGAVFFNPDFTQGDLDPSIYEVVVEAADEADPGLVASAGPAEFRVFNVNQAPELASIEDASICAENSLTIEISATDVDDDPIDMWVDPLVPNMTFDYPGGGIGQLIFDPTSAQIGTYPTTAYASDGLDTVMQSFTINVIDCAAQDSGLVMVAGQPISIVVKFAVLDTPITKVYLGDFIGGHAVTEIVPSSIRIAGSITPTDYTEVPGYAGYTVSPVAEIKFESWRFVDLFGAFFDTLYEPLVVTGEFDDGSSFSTSTVVALTGHRSGDVTMDGNTDIRDVIAVVGWMYRGLAEPNGLVAADCDGKCGLNISDLTYYVNFLYRGGPPPVESCP